MFNRLQYSCANFDFEGVELKGENFSDLMDSNSLRSCNSLSEIKYKIVTLDEIAKLLGVKC